MVNVYVSGLSDNMAGYSFSRSTTRENNQSCFKVVLDAHKFMCDYHYEVAWKSE